jgi:competence protein ComEC
VLTHPHGDHVGGLSAVLREESVGVVLDGTCLPYPSPAYTAFLALVHQKHIRYIHAVRGMKLVLDRGVTADVLNPPAQGFAYGTNPDNDTMNNYSAVLRISYGRTHFLLDGDAQAEAEASMLAAFGDLSSDVLKCGHHGSRNASTDAWLTRVNPRYAAISCGAHNTFGHPSPETMARLAAHGVTTFVTAKNGAISFESDGQTVTAHPFLH